MKIKKSSGKYRLFYPTYDCKLTKGGISPRETLQKLEKVLYVICSLETESLEQIEDTLRAGALVIQLREKYITKLDYILRARKLRAMTKRFGGLLIINDSPLVARVSCADGVHVGNKDSSVKLARAIVGEELIVGATAKTPEVAKGASLDGADYVGSGAMFESGTKLDTTILSVETLKSIVATGVPTFAIGGITPKNINELVMEMGENFRALKGVCVSGGIFRYSQGKIEPNDLVKNINNLKASIS